MLRLNFTDSLPHKRSYLSSKYIMTLSPTVSSGATRVTNSSLSLGFLCGLLLASTLASVTVHFLLSRWNLLFKAEDYFSSRLKSYKWLPTKRRQTSHVLTTVSWGSCGPYPLHQCPYPSSPEPQAHLLFLEHACVLLFGEGSCPEENSMLIPSSCLTFAQMSSPRSGHSRLHNLKIPPHNLFP